MSQPRICPEKERNRFRVLRSIFIILLFASGVGMGFFVYYLVSTALSIEYSAYLMDLDSTNPPYVAIIMFAVFFLSLIGLRHSSRLENDLCF